MKQGKKPKAWLAGALVVGVVLAFSSAAVAQCMDELHADPPSAGDFFGRHVAIKGDDLLIGAYGNDLGGNDAGAAYVFHRSEGQWVQQARLVPDDAVAGVHFGYTVAIEGDYAIIAATLDIVDSVRSGAGYIFRRDQNGTPNEPSDDVWLQQSKLLPKTPGPNGLFGTFVDLEGRYAVVGADNEDTPILKAGAAYVFVRDDAGTPSDPADDTWVRQAYLTADDAQVNDLFGRSIGISGAWIIVGVYADDDRGNAAGSAYFFRKDDAGTPDDPMDDSWIQHVEVYGSDTSAADQFGIGVAIDGDYAVVGAMYNDAPVRDAGSAYVFLHDDAGTPGDLSDDTWTEQARLTAADASEGALLGRFVDIDGPNVLAGAYQDDTAGVDAGAAYLFVRDDAGTPSDPSDDMWSQQLKLVPADGLSEDNFGHSVALDGGTALLGALKDDDAGQNAGSAYVADLFGGNDCNSNGLNDGCEEDCNNNGYLDACELAGGTSPDCNANARPDTCDIDAGDSFDCNMNSVPDECDLAAGTSPDCNQNATPDECETLATGIDQDGDLDLADFARFQACFSGPGLPPSDSTCCVYDFDQDNDVDLNDYLLLQAAFSGPM